MSTFREPTPEEIKLATIQFIGQNLGAIKDLDNRLIDKNHTLQGMTINPTAVVNSIPAPNRPNHFAPQHHGVVVEQHAAHRPAPAVQQPAQVAPVSEDPNQLTFDFDNSATAEKIYNIVDKLLVKFESLDNKLNKILSKISS